MKNPAVAIVTMLLMVGCAIAEPDEEQVDFTESGGLEGTGDGTAGSGSGSGGGSEGGGTTTPPGPPADFGCHASPPDNVPMPPPAKAYSGGSCPALQAGFNELHSGGAARQFMLALPSDLDPGERLPVVFLWHWLGGDAQSFYDRGHVQAAVDLYRFAAVIPEAKGDLIFKWPFEASQPQGRIDEELTFFDDMLACVSEQLSVNSSCVSSMGVSAGALFTPVLAGARGDYLSSIGSMSGGVGGIIKNWQSANHRMPAMVLWGGPADNCFGLMDFDQTSRNLEVGLQQDNHFFLECVHNCGHAAPPFDAPDSPTAFAPLWEFFLDHPYWLEAGQSPYLDEGLPSAMPSWCDIGKGSATPRDGACVEQSGC